MLSKKYQYFFGNFFSDKNITMERLLNFGDDTTARLSAANGDGSFTATIAQLNAAREAFFKNHSSTDVALALRKGASLTADTILAGFKELMKTADGIIAYSLGGRQSPGFLQFYPRGKKEYNGATKTLMPTLTGRVFTAANKYKDALPADVYNNLVVYKDGWANARTEQESKKGNVTNARSSRRRSRTDYEEALLAAMHFVGSKYPGDIKKGKQFFQLWLLYPVTKHKHLELTGSLQPLEQKTIISRIFSGVAKIIAKNTDDNASMAAWFAPNEDAVEMPPHYAIILNVREHREIKPADIGNNELNTFLIIKNLSHINMCDYAVEMVG